MTQEEQIYKLQKELEAKTNEDLLELKKLNLQLDSILKTLRQINIDLVQLNNKL